ncbi:uncharacterized protein LOC111103340 [Crassostrea virginica]
MKASFVQLLLLMITIGGECCVEIFRPMSSPDIKLYSANTTYNPDTQKTTFILYFRGPSDTKEESGIPLTELSSKPEHQTSVFMAEKQVNIAGENTHPEEFWMKLSSASKSTTLILLLKATKTDEFTWQFPGQSCLFELRKDMDDGTSKYYVTLKNEQTCPLTNWENDIVIWTEFTVKLPENFSSHDHTSDSSKNKNDKYFNRTVDYLILNEDYLKTDGFQTVRAYYEMWAWPESSPIQKYGWKVELPLKY